MVDLDAAVSQGRQPPARRLEIWEKMACDEGGHVAHAETAAWDDARRAFADSAAWFAELTTGVGSRWDAPGLGVWTVRDLVGHTSRALLTVEAYLGDHPGEIELHSPADYYSRVFAIAGDPDAVAQRGRDAGAALGEDPVSAVATIVSRVVAQVTSSAAEDRVLTPAGLMRLVDYLGSRTFELTVHSVDLAAALGVPAVVPRTAAAQSVALVGELAWLSGQVPTLLSAVTGRCALPPGFSVL